jgi:serine/threonine protein kinase
MPLAGGARLGPYEIVAPLGAGGMGEVYKAVDTRLDRTVALKIMKGSFNDRFTREAKAISALNHPNICTLFDLGEQDGTSYLVMEFLEGKPLEGPLPWAEARTFALQLLEALETAHRAGVVHRDVKPANIVVTKAGVKLLDFGLAKSASVVLGPTDATLTQEGTIQGTPHYMAPEQAAGGNVDARGDIFAFGAVLYERC